MKITLPRWYDLHTHLRQDALLASLIRAQLEMGCAGVLAMPNTKPPCAKILKSDDGPHESLESYREKIMAAGGDAFQTLITPLYLTQDTTPTMIEHGVKTGLLTACKYYPPHGTTGAEFGQPLDSFMENGVLKAMEGHGVTLCIHGEEHGQPGPRYFDRTQNAEDIFYETRMPALVDRFPGLKIACEHVTTAKAAAFVRACGPNVAASVTPQHLLYTVGDLLQGLKYHLYCLPLPKFEADRQALREAVTDPANTKFYAGTDSAPHTQKATPCGCAAGCFTGGIAPQLYAQGFEEAGLDLSHPENQKTFENFLCRIGMQFYDLPDPQGTFTLVKEDSEPIKPLHTESGEITPLPLGLGQETLPWTLKL